MPIFPSFLAKYDLVNRLHELVYKIFFHLSSYKKENFFI
ncbi:hypothetical protein bthur0004_20800 [Bacillus thuringiensis serovar sotto str. T04001]|nr:hypothetical protein bthur0004_20800 [Bacillus thuringiensis serovar sotto str. T04001]